MSFSIGSTSSSMSSLSARLAISCPSVMSNVSSFSRFMPPACPQPFCGVLSKILLSSACSGLCRSSGVSSAKSPSPTVTTFKFCSTLLASLSRFSSFLNTYDVLPLVLGGCGSSAMICNAAIFLNKTFFPGCNFLGSNAPCSVQEF